MGALDVVQSHVGAERHSSVVFNNFHKIVRQLSENKRVLEIGAGRNPIFSSAELADGNIDYVANDISPDELDAMQVQVPSAAFDASQGIPDHFVGNFDFVFSNMVQEHVRDTRAFYRNIAIMLRPGGVALHFHPVLFTLPFLINRFVPEAATEPLLYAIRKDRTRSRAPKFPAHYDQCVVSDRVARRLAAEGYASVTQIPFYGHGYYRFLPPLHAAQRAFAKLAAKREVTPLATFSLTLATK